MKKDAKNGKSKAKRPRLSAKTARKTKRKLGTYGDTIKIAEDFDAPLPEDILRAFEGDLDLEDKPQQEK